jgi:hypothetical protein
LPFRTPCSRESLPAGDDTGSDRCRDHDTYGLGYYLINNTDDLPRMPGMNAEQGTELFYNIEVTPWLHSSPNLHVIVDPGAGYQDRDVGDRKEPIVVHRFWGGDLR